MNQSLKKAAQSVQEALVQKGLKCRVVELSDSARTAQAAALAIGCDVAQIFKSLVFETKETHQPILILASSNRVNERVKEARRKKTAPRLLLFLFLILLPSPASAILHLELTHGVDSAIPITVLPFGETHQPEEPAISEIIAQDLYHSGEFKLKNHCPPSQHSDTVGSRADKTLRDTHCRALLMPNGKESRRTGRAPTESRGERNAEGSEGQLDIDFWKQRGIDYLILGHLKPNASEPQLTVQVISLYPTPNETPLLFSRTYRVGPPRRSLAHQIADDLYEKITGSRGIFSTHIAYVMEQRLDRHRSIYSLMIADADGHRPQKLLSSPDPIMSPAWTPDGREIAYVSFERARSAIYLSNLATGQRKLISQFPGINGAPAFSPDGQKLALVLSKTGHPKIYLLNLQTKRLEQLTQGSSIDTEPAWSADGQTLLFTSDRGGSPQIYQLYLSTRRIERVTYDGDYNARASVAPNGRHIVVLHREQGRFNIAVQNWETGTLTLLSRANNDQSPSLSPNGKMVIYTSQEGSGSVLNLVSIDGRIRLTLPENSGAVREPVWQPFLK